MLEKITSDNNLSCHFIQKEKREVVTVDGVLVSIGRSADTKELFSTEAIIEMDQGKNISKMSSL